MNTSKSPWLGLLVGVLGSTAFAANSSNLGQRVDKVVDVQAIQAQLAQTGAGWTAGESWVTRLSRAEVQRMLGLKTLPKGQLDFRAESWGPWGKKVRSWDWRNVDGVNWLGPVMNQGNCGSCVAFSTVATLEAQTSITAGIPWLNPSYSPEMLFECGGGSCDEGWEPDSAASFLMNSGVADEACMPYTSGSTGNDVACTAACGDSASRSFKVNSFSTPSQMGGSIEAVKAALRKGPLMTTLTVYADFITYSSGVFKHMASAGDELGGHAISLVGYNDAKKAWLIRNSWGPEWGEKGFAWVSWNDVSGVGANTWALEITPTDHYITVVSPSDREFVSGDVPLRAQTKGLAGGMGDTQFHVVGADSSRISGISCGAAALDGCAAKLDTSKMSEGRYEIYADSSSNPGIKSQVREFFVLNHVPTATLTLAPAAGLDIHAPLTGRPEFEITADSGAVPLAHLEFRVLDSKGRIASVKSNDYILPQMKMGWRTMTVPSGKYTLIVHGETTYQGKVYGFDSNSIPVTTIQN